MARILIENGQTVISPEQAMKWYCWHEIVEPMEKLNSKAVKMAIDAVVRDCPDWEINVLKKYLEITDADLFIN